MLVRTMLLAVGAMLLFGNLALQLRAGGSAPANGNDTAGPVWSHGQGEKSVYHEVGPRDTLQSIATEIYGDPSKWVVIYEHNFDVIMLRGGELIPGQRLLVP